jgi:SAM-dependent methyltransferase
VTDARPYRESSSHAPFFPGAPSRARAVGVDTIRLMRDERQSDQDEPSQGYEVRADEFAARRSSHIGVPQVTAWASTLPQGAAVLDLGCGTGVPISETLIQAGCSMYAIDASPRMVAAFQARFPDVPAVCEPIEQSAMFGRTFDGAIAWGVMFLLAENIQAEIIRRVSRALRTGGSFLFTAPFQTCTWTDSLTGRPSVSLGAETYRHLLTAAGLTVVREYQDDGGNYYYESRKD